MLFVTIFYVFQPGLFPLNFKRNFIGVNDQKVTIRELSKTDFTR